MISKKNRVKYIKLACRKAGILEEKERGCEGPVHLSLRCNYLRIYRKACPMARLRGYAEVLPNHLVSIRQPSLLVIQQRENEFLFAFSLNLVPSYTAAKKAAHWLHTGLMIQHSLLHVIGAGRTQKTYGDSNPLETFKEQVSSDQSSLPLGNDFNVPSLW